MWVYLAPHLDDAVYSCGAQIFCQTQSGEEVVVLTICAGDPPSGALSPFAQVLHTLWGVNAERAVAVRRAEDQAACALLGARAVHWEIPDAIYRRAAQDIPYYPDNDAIFGPLHPEEQHLVHILAQRLRDQFPPTARLVSPLAIGNHVDHQLTRRAAEASGRVTHYYADFPYAAREPQTLEALRANWQMAFPPPDEEDALHAWLEGIRTYSSQFGVFWEDDTALENEVRGFIAHGGGALWLPARSSGA